MPVDFFVTIAHDSPVDSDTLTIRLWDAATYGAFGGDEFNEFLGSGNRTNVTSSAWEKVRPQEKSPKLTADPTALHGRGSYG